MAANLIWGAQIYLGIGAVVALAFLTVGLGRVDAQARGVWVFRPLLVPGVLLIWPLVVLRWAALEWQAGEGQGRFRPPLAAQSRAALVLALVIPAIIAGALAIRQDVPTDAAAVQIEPPR